MIKPLFLFITVFFVVSSRFTGFSQNKPVYIELKASALFNDVAAVNYCILVYENGILKDSIFAKKAKATNITVESDRVYSIVFKKDNGSEKLVIVNTFLPRGITDLDQEPFKLEVELSPESSKIKQEFDDYPVAILIVSKKKKLLMASEDYFQLTHIQEKGKKS